MTYKKEQKLTLNRLKKFQRSFISGMEWIGADDNPCLKDVKIIARQLNDEVNRVARAIKAE